MALSPVQDRSGASAAPASRPAGMALPVDLVLVAATLGLCAISLLMLDAVTGGGNGVEPDVPGDPGYFVTRQAIFMVVGAIAAIVVSRIDYSRLRELRHGLYVLLLLLILAVFAVGSSTGESKRAISLGLFELQTSEIGKVLLIVVVSAFMVERSREIGLRDTTARAMLLTLVPAALVMAEDLGSGMVFIVIGLTVLFVAGTPWRHLVGLVALGAASIALVVVVAPAAGVEVLKPYQEARLTSFLRPAEDTGGAAYQQIQSEIAIGAGQKTGLGDRATQTRLEFVPAHHTDFAYASAGERWGFAGAALVLSLYALLVWRAIRILTGAKNLLGALIAAGVAALLLFQLFINVGMNVGIMPITGIPLPLLSYGGSSVISTFLAIGLLHSIYSQGRGAAAVKGRLRL